MRWEGYRLAIRRLLALLSVLSLGAGLVIPTTASTAAAASTPTFFKTLAGPSMANMYSSGLAWDAPSSRLVVADTGNDRVEFYTESGTKLGQFGSYGTANGQFDTPRDAAIDPSSKIYIADAGNNRIQKFDSSGNWIWSVGGLGSCHTCLNTPIGLTWDFTNNVLLVASTGQSLIKAFDANGNWLWQSPSGTLTGLSSPRDVARGPDGRIWVADYKHHQVKAYNVSNSGTWTSDTPAAVLGDGLSSGHGAGELNFPYNVDFSADGTIVYVADTGNERIAQWNISGSAPVWLNPIGSKCAVPCPNPPASMGMLEHLRRVVVVSDGTIFGDDFWGNGIDHYGADGAVLGEIEGYHAPAPGFAQAFGIAVATDGTTYGVDRLNQRIERFDSAGNYLNEVGQRGTVAGAYSWPEAVAVAPDLSVWLADTRNDRLQHYPADVSGKPTALGSTGSASNQFNNPTGLTVDSGGKVWVADTLNNRIHVYDPSTGTHTVFGALGSGPGQFDNPQGVAVSSSAVYVADTLNNRIEELDLNGNYIASSSTGLAGPEGVALAADGTLWVADTQNSRLVHLSADLSAVLGDGFGSPGTGDYQFFNPHSLAVHGTTLFVADTFNNRVQEFTLAPLISSGPAYSRQIFNAGGVAPLYPAAGVADSTGSRYVADSGGSRIVKIDSGGNQTTVTTAVSDPRSIAWDADGVHLWVASTSNSAIVEIGTDGTIVHSYTAAGGSKFKTPYGVAADSTGIYIADTYNQRVVKMNGATGAQLWNQTTCFGNALKRPRGLTVGSDGSLYVADTDNDRIVELDPAAGTCISSFGATGTGNGQFKSPWTTLSDGSGGLWVADAMNYRVQHVSNTGTFISTLGTFGTGNGQFLSPHGLFMDQGLLDVADPYEFEIQRFTISGGALTFNSIVGGVPPAPGGFNQPFAVAYGPSGEMYVVDWFNDRIEKFNPDGSFALQWGTYGSKNGSFIFPRGIAVTPDGKTVVITNSEDSRLDLYSPTGGFVKSIKPVGTSFSRPHQTALAPDGSYWVADTKNNRVLHLDTSGNVLMTITNGGALKSPQGVALDSSGNVYVSDNGNNAVESYNSTSGALTATLATSGSGSTNVKAPIELAIDPVTGDLLIADSGNNRVVVLTTAGAPVVTFGSAGTDAGQFNAPHDMAINPLTEEVAVADFSNNRISIWEP
jgi:DNA-binding beta-propeller fold protein YncE